MLGFTFRPTAQSQLILVSYVSLGQVSLFLQTGVQLFQHHWLKKPPFFQRVAFAPLSKSVGHICVDFFLLILTNDIFSL